MKFSNLKKFLNKVLKSKATKLSLLGASTIALLLTSSHSYAKYYNEFYNDENAGIARFENGIITYNAATIKQPSDENNLKEGYHAFVCEFHLEIPNVEVKTSYEVRLRLVSNENDDFNSADSGLSYSSFTSSKAQDKFYTFVEQSGKIVTQERTLSQITGGTINYSQNYWYYATSLNGTQYTWNRSNEFHDSSKGIVLLDSGEVAAGSSVSKYFKMVIFINAYYKDLEGNEMEWFAEPCKILYELKAEQEE